MEHKEGSGSKPHHQIRPKLDEQGVESLEEDFKSLLIVPESSKYSDVELLSDEMEVHSDVEVSSFEKQGWCDITRNSDLSSATLQNKSLDVILFDGTDVRSEDTTMFKCGSEIVPPPVSDVYSSYEFKVMPMNESSKMVFKFSLDSEHAKCSLCLGIWHDAVTVAPCLHNFCNGCFSEWLRRSQEKHACVLCPCCRSAVQSVGRNHFLDRIVEEIHQGDAFLRRGDEEHAFVNSFSLEESRLIIDYGKKPGNKTKRARSMPVEEFYQTCDQCETEYGGFQCNQSTMHLQCHACGVTMPSRSDICVPQHCIGCDRAFCGAYWHSQQVTRSEVPYICAPDNFKPIGERSITRIPSLAHERNRHEQDITEKCIQLMGKTLQDVVSQWVTKLDNREIDLTKMPLNHPKMITSGTYICNGCYDKLVSFLLYWFRICLPKSLRHIPVDAGQREDCWYGYTCRTQHHNDDHARKRNHVCPPTKGRIGN